jgi:endoglucanase
MITKYKFLAIMILAAIITFPMATCENSTGGGIGLTDPGNQEPPDLGPSNPEPFNDVSAAELVANIRVGWNLGNTLDCADLSWLGNNPSVSRLETAWGNPVTSQANIETLKNAGFNVIRIPVSWSKCANPNDNYKIRAEWMARVKQVVNFAVNCDMYIILNTHHDEDIFKFRDNEMTESAKAFGKIWEQIAGAFRDYNEKLIFEGLNEPRTKGSSAEWNGGTAEERKNLNAMNQLFVDTVRASGSNNVRRILLIPSYGASAVPQAMEAVVIPSDPANAKNKIIVSIHAYSPYNFALNKDSPINTWNKNNVNETRDITGPVDRAYTLFVSKGIPVILGEFGAMNKNNTADRAEWAEFYVGSAKSKGIPCIWWDNGATSGDGELFGLLDRRANNFTYPEIVEALMRGTQ